MQPTPAAQARRLLAERITAAYVDNPKVAAVILGGSAARGYADRYSDLEVGVFWHEPPTDDDRRSCIERTGGDLHWLHDYDAAEGVWSDDWKIGRNQKNEPFTGVSVDMLHFLVTQVDMTLEALVIRHDPDPLKQNLIAGILGGIPLHGHEQVRRWRAAAGSYPDGLVRAVVQANAQIDHFWRFEMFRSRGNVWMAHAAVAEIQEKLLHVLLGVNRVYYFGFKWLDQVVARLAICPPDLLARLRSCADPLAPAAEATLAQLVEQTYQIVEQQVPDVDVNWLRRVFRYRRPLWEAMPPC